VPSPPKILEPIHCHFGIADGALDVLMAEAVLQRARIVTIVRELIAAGVPKHMRVDAEGHFGGLTKALNKPVEAYGTYWSTALAHEDTAEASVRPGSCGRSRSEPFYVH
jgi:hypothetical protein